SSFSSKRSPNSLYMSCKGSVSARALRGAVLSDLGPSCRGILRRRREMGSTLECMRPARCTIFRFG
ncbi:hypothetical protein PLICRDRAFT_97593, partial [Plicaturopsis crispa FD-325 SS-3]